MTLRTFDSTHVNPDAVVCIHLYWQWSMGLESWLLADLRVVQSSEPTMGLL